MLEQKRRAGYGTRDAFNTGKRAQICSERYTRCKTTHPVHSQGPTGRITALRRNGRFCPERTDLSGHLFANV